MMRFTIGKEGIRGFSLVEILVALSIALVLGGSFFVFVPQAFDAFYSIRKRVASSSDANFFDYAFERDFSSIVPSLGFHGDADSCNFWTARAGVNGSMLCHVSYVRHNGGIMVVKTDPDQYLENAYTNRFPLVPLPAGEDAICEKTLLDAAAGEFLYGGTNLNAELEQSWSSPTNSPFLIRVLLKMNGEAISRTYAGSAMP